jgi:putative hemolysin
MAELADYLGMRRLPDDEGGSYETLSGLVMFELDRMPKTGDRVTWAGWMLAASPIAGFRTKCGPLPR